MSSILTNNSAMVALQTLKSVNQNLAMTQSEISTGKSVATARDNSAVWAISKTMESDVAGFNAISESLSLGSSTVAVARNAAETTTDMLQQMKEKIVAAQESNVDRSKLQTDIEQLARQINSVTNAAQFNGLNLVRGGADVDVLSSLDRGSDGTVTAASISVTRQDLSETADVMGGGAKAVDIGTLSDTDTDASLTATDQSVALTITAANSETLTLTLNDVEIRYTMDATATADEGRDGLIAAFAELSGVDSRLDGITLTNTGAGQVTVTNTNNLTAVTVDGVGTGAADITGDANLARSGETITFAANAAVSEGDSFDVTIAGNDSVYVARAGDTAEDVAKGIAASIQASGNTLLEASAVEEGGNWVVAIGTTGATDLSIAYDELLDGTAGGDLFGLSSINVTTDGGASNALGLIETMIERSINAAAELGSEQGRIETQSTFISNLTDSFTSGIGTLVDANMEEASAKLQALQVQQQLAIQSLSIANQAPQSILSLFR